MSLLGLIFLYRVDNTGVLPLALDLNNAKSQKKSTGEYREPPFGNYGRASNTPENGGPNPKRTGEKNRWFATRVRPKVCDLPLLIELGLAASLVEVCQIC